ncbi:MAG: hypothetical protein IID34_14140 [Planctomycetes bacterium]|nr:hypothetical protein [Planctomycetota bacterium]
MGKLKAFDDQLRNIIRTCGQSRYEIWKATGIDQAALSKFMLGERGLSMKALIVLGKHLNLIVTQKRRI